MLRIKTKFSESYHVLTLFSLGKWVTISVTNGKSSSTDALNLTDAGRNHLISAHKVKIEYEFRERNPYRTPAPGQALPNTEDLDDGKFIPHCTGTSPTEDQELIFPPYNPFRKIDV